jgi:hypothetical protein
MRDAEVHHDDSVEELLRELNAPRRPGFIRRHLSGRFGFMLITVALHVIAALVLIGMQYGEHPISAPDPITVSLIEAPVQQAETPPQYTPPVNVVYALPTPPEMSFETESITTETSTAAIATGTSNAGAADGRVGRISARRAACHPRNRCAKSTAP